MHTHSRIGKIFVCFFQKRFISATTEEEQLFTFWSRLVFFGGSFLAVLVFQRIIYNQHVCLPLYLVNTRRVIHHPPSSFHYSQNEQLKANYEKITNLTQFILSMQNLHFLNRPTEKLPWANMLLERASELLPLTTSSSRITPIK